MKTEYRPDSEFLQHEPCPHCGSKDNLARYSDGHGFCFGCKYYEHPDQPQGEIKTEMIRGKSKPLNSRRITSDTASLFNYEIGKDGEKTVHIANYFDDQKNLVAQKLRTPDKKFSWKGYPQQTELYGQWLWREGGKMVTVTEGEIDALTISQVFGHNKYAVVSIPNGIANAEKSCKRSLEWLEKFERINICFDNDELGKEKAKKVAQLFTPGKAYIVTLPSKDASDMLQGNKESELVDALWGARPYHPDGIVDHAGLLEYIRRPKNKESKPYPFDGLTDKTHGLRRGELVTVCAGTGVGKSQFCRQVTDTLLRDGEKVGYIALEESVQRTVEGLMSLRLGKAIHTDTRDWSDLSDDEQTERMQVYHELKGLYCYDHFGSIDSQNLINRIRFMAKACDVHWVVLDHLSIMSSAFADGDERRLIDQTMTTLRSLVEETNIGLILVSHLRRPDGNKGYENGMELSLSALRGSHSISQLSDSVLGIERDLSDEQNISVVRVLKNRFSGDTGVACRIQFDPSTTQLRECSYEEEGETSNDF
ncbi:MAG: hypothetical protein CMQ40_05045 [Gammaproteobacteria bacterium]|nr:hypothetical protein [Gammaproteobacteria bacterium]|tara:strand:- start:1349 stop:2956 length:1608 start_codon:yes stop_codon:yes gene_type:complete